MDLDYTGSGNICMTMRFAINGRFLGRKLTGVDRFADETIKALDEILEQDEVLARSVRIRLLVPENCGETPCYKNIVVQKMGKLPGLLWEQFSLPFALCKGERLINLCNTAPIWRKSHIWVLHDAATKSMPEVYSWKFKLWYQILIPVLLKTANHVLTVSEFSRNDIAKQYDVNPKNIGVISEGGEHILNVASDQNILKKYDLDNTPYLFAVSSMAKHKNFKLVLQAIENMVEVPFKVAIAGGANMTVFGGQHATPSGNKDAVHWLGYVSNEELRALYESAYCFVFPSTYEGFGIPPLEAMNCGTPVLAANAASIPEVCGDAADYFNPNDPKELAQKLNSLFSDQQKAKLMSQSSLSRAKLFSWHGAAQQLLMHMTSTPESA
ncbi:glycosyltransferase family 4 protein [Neiella marina]|uniref:Glycosyltransferase family 4 protein n=1 Tax=Neiella holothuriorum TaxID=2870530 RepID=A0ABS7EE28_9GAMM|nr:glycosyltransferase family 1 protein [Neiella holothuriorum]MBW8190576.1 glycosyltransferase family 4 protein [Neiella holothuriorum]